MCSAVVVIVEVSLTRKRVHARVIVSSVNIVFEDSRGAQVGYTGPLCIYSIEYTVHNILQPPYPDPIIGSRSRDFS